MSASETARYWRWPGEGALTRRLVGQLNWQPLRCTNGGGPGCGRHVRSGSAAPPSRPAGTRPRQPDRTKPPARSRAGRLLLLKGLDGNNGLRNGRTVVGTRPLCQLRPRAQRKAHALLWAAMQADGKTHPLLSWCAQRRPDRSTRHSRNVPYPVGLAAHWWISRAGAPPALGHPRYGASPRWRAMSDLRGSRDRDRSPRRRLRCHGKPTAPLRKLPSPQDPRYLTQARRHASVDRGVTGPVRSARRTATGSRTASLRWCTGTLVRLRRRMGSCMAIVSQSNPAGRRTFETGREPMSITFTIWSHSSVNRRAHRWRP